MDFHDFSLTATDELASLYVAASRIGSTGGRDPDHDAYYADLMIEVDTRIDVREHTLAVLDVLMDATETAKDREYLGVSWLEMVVRDRQDLWQEFERRCRHDSRWNQAFGAAWVPARIANQLPLGLRATVMHID